MDSGAEENFLRESTVTHLSLNKESIPHVEILFGNGSTSISDEAARLNSSLSAIILPDKSLVEDLISTNPIVELGYEVLLTSGGGSILKNGEEVMPITRNRSKWHINLQDLRKLQCLVVHKADHTNLIHTLHKRMGHPSSKEMINALQTQSWLCTEISPEDIKAAFTIRPCAICQLAKQNRQPIPRSLTDPTTSPIGTIISGDIIGPITPTNKKGHGYFFLFVDRTTSFYHTFTSATKDGFLTSLQYVFNYYKQHGHPMHTFRSDSEKILVEGKVAEFLADENVRQQFSLPYAHHQNLVERHVQTVVKSISTVMHDQAILGASFWDYALFHVVSLKNNTPNVKTKGKTPFALITNSPALDLQRRFLFPFGSPVAVRIPDRTWKFDVKNELAVYLGEADGSVNGGLVYYPSTKAIVTRHNLTPLTIRHEDFTRLSNIRETIKDHSPTANEQHLLIDIPNELIPEMDQSQDNPDQESKEGQHFIETTRAELEQFIKGVMTRKMTKLSALAAQVYKRPTNELTKALSGPEKEQWTQALQTEIKSILEITKSLTPEVPIGIEGKDYDVIPSTVVLKKKTTDGITINKYKVRIPVCGNHLLRNAGYDHITFSPTVSPLVHTSLLQASIHEEMHMATYDTIAAYLYQYYPQHFKPLYVRFPKKLAEACGLDPHTLYRVLKYLYGLPDAGRAYYEAYSAHLVEHGYIKSISDPCLFYKLDHSRNLRTWIWFHVDDTLVSSTHKEELTIFENILKLKFQITADYDVTSHLGITLTRKDDGSIKLTQPKLLAEILQEYDSSTSMYPATVTAKDPASTAAIESSTYLRLLGQLMYLTNSRPDIMTAVAYASTHSTKPTKHDFQDLIKIVAYLRQTPEIGLILYPRDKTESDDKEKDAFHLTAYVDAGYMSHPDASSHTGYTIALGSVTPKSFYHSKSQKQKLIATSSTHAEIRAL